MLDPEPDVLADPGAADLSLSDRISDPACGHVEIRRGFVDRQKRSLCLNQTFGPAKLLALEGGHFDWKLSWTHNFRKINKLPSLHLGTIA